MGFKMVSMYQVLKIYFLILITSLSRKEFSASVMVLQTAAGKSGHRKQQPGELDNISIFT